MKRLMGVAMLLALGTACANETTLTGLVGGSGTLRFNLQFTNETNVDLDLHVVTPSGNEIYYADPTDEATGGELDIDCLCGDCPNGPNENIFWPLSGDAESGTYQIRVNYFGSCGLELELPPSEYTLRILEGQEVMGTFTGTLGGGTIFDEEFDEYVYTYGSVEGVGE